MATVCKLRKFGLCKFGKFCNFVHVDKACEVKDCEAKKCNLRHPKTCRYILKYGRCKFSEFCSYNHKIDKLLCPHPSDNIEVDLGKKLIELEKKLEAMQKEIVFLSDKIKVFENDKHSSYEESETESSEIEVGNTKKSP